MRALTIGKLAREAQVNLETIRYYERITLLQPPPRTDSGHRAYGDADVRRLVFIRRARELGFSISSIRALLVLGEPGRMSCDDVRQIAVAHLENVRAKLTDLTKLEQVLSDTVTQCTGAESPGCPMIEILSASA